MINLNSCKTNIEPAKSLTDRELIAFLHEGNDEAILQLLQKIRSIVRFIRNKKLADYELDETDLVHDVYIFLQKNNFGKLRSFRFESQLNTWLFPVCYRFISKQYKRLLKEKALKMTLLDGIVLYVKDETTQKYLVRAEVLDAISKLTDKREQMVLLLNIQDKEVKDIAQELETTVNNVYTIKSRAIEKLKKLLHE